MKYHVRIGDREHEVVVEGDTAAFAGGPPVAAHSAMVAGTPIRLVTIGDTVHRVVVRPGAARGEYTLWVGGHRFDADAVDERTRTIRSLAGATAAAAGPKPLTAPMPGLVVRVAVSPGDEVQAGQGLIVMEAMKMENELRATAAGRVTRVHVTPGTAVEKGAMLVELE